jgi:hypothetical protein
VTVYRDRTCTSTIATVTTWSGGCFAVHTSVTDNSTTTFSARALDAVGHLSPCVGPIVYVEDNSL